MAADALKKREGYFKRLGALKTEFSSWRAHYMDINEYIRPRRGRFLVEDRNKGWKRNQQIINGTPLWSIRTLAAGMMAGITSPARQWFRLTTPDQDLAGFGPVRAYLDTVQERMQTAFARSNIYSVFHGCYEYLGTFGTHCFMLEDDFHSILRGYAFPVGQYYLANSARGEVDTVYRQFSMTVGQMVEKFGLDNCSRAVRDAYASGDYHVWHEVLHVIEPNREYQAGKLGPVGMRYSSCWLERSEEARGTPFLKEAGYDGRPFCAPRWHITAEDVYGESPGMDALGDCRALQLLERRKAQAVDKVVNPPMRAPMSLQNQRASLLPGDITYVDSIQPNQTFAPAYEMPPAAVQVASESVREHEQRIKSAFFADLWLMLVNGQEDPRKTATEVAALKDEKMQQLGPVMERLEDELLDPVIERTFDILQRARLLPPPPKELQGQHVAVEYISIMAQAQRALNTSAKERLVAFVGSMAGARPEVMDKVDWDAMVEDYAEDIGLKTTLIIPEDKVQAIRQQRAQKAAQQQAIQQNLAAVQAAQTMSKTDTGGDNALTRLLGGVSPVAGGAAGGSVQ